MVEAAETLVGRDHEVSRLERLLDETCNGSHRFVVITGEPGIGKTRLLAHLVRRADERGCLALNGRAAEFERELPFGLVVDAFDDYLESLDAWSIDRLAADGLGELGAVFPALRSLRSGADPPTTTTERFRAYHAVRELMERLAARQPLVVVFDDLHWADGASLELAAHLLRRPPQAAVLVAGSFRTGQADPGVVAEITAAADRGQLEQIELGPLTSSEAAQLMASAAGSDTTESSRVYRESGGNPLYLLQLARRDVRSGLAAGPDGSRTDVPSLIATAVARELGALSSAARTLGEAASVVGDPFDLDLAATTADMTEPDALAAIDELLGRDLVRASEVPRRFNFRHPIVRNAVYQSYGAGARLHAHERCAAALSARGAPPMARAHHLEHARHGDLDAVAVLGQAGEACAQQAPASAAHWFTAALRLLPATAPNDERVGLLTALAGALGATGRFDEGRTALVEAISLVPEDTPAVRVGLTAACAGIEQLLGRNDAARARLMAALDELPDEASPEGVALMTSLALSGFYGGDYARMHEWALRAATAARAVGQLTLMSSATSILAMAAAFDGAIAQAQVHYAEATTIVDAMPDEQLAQCLESIGFLSGADMYLDRWDDALAHAERGLALARATGQGHLVPMLYPSLGTSTWMRGRMAESAELLDQAVEAARLSRHAQGLAWILFNRSLAALMAGDLETALVTGRESVELAAGLDTGPITAYANVTLASALFEAGDAATAVDMILAAGGGEELPLLPGGWRANYFELLTRCYLALGRRSDADRLVRRAEAWSEVIGLPLPRLMAHRAAAAVALDRGDAAEAGELAVAAAAAGDEIGASIDATQSRLLAGRAFLAAGDAERAIILLEQAANEFDAYGAPRYREQAERELRRLGRRFHRRTAPGTGGSIGVGSLSGRELEVARLVVDRRTNPEIASELFLGLKTVETHMRNIFRKLGVSSRVEVARVVERAGT